MDTISTTTWVILIVILLHFIVGFGYLMYKLSPKKKTDLDAGTEESIDADL